MFTDNKKTVVAIEENKDNQVATVLAPVHEKTAEKLTKSAIKKANKKLGTKKTAEKTAEKTEFSPEKTLQAYEKHAKLATSFRPREFSELSQNKRDIVVCAISLFRVKARGNFENVITFSKSELIAFIEKQSGVKIGNIKDCHNSWPIFGNRGDMSLFRQHITPEESKLSPEKKVSIEGSPERWVKMRLGFRDKHVSMQSGLYYSCPTLAEIYRGFRIGKENLRNAALRIANQLIGKGQGAYCKKSGIIE
jgi:hypothetical protein